MILTIVIIPEYKDYTNFFTLGLSVCIYAVSPQQEARRR